ncbi:DUF4265 domain-containing protein [Streptomyces mirabilis]|uniref:DUF4265 domain-containing protein n=1 Tax=Streptomyces mirabilis TaxID=68239 RepID=UPI0036959407
MVEFDRHRSASFPLGARTTFHASNRPGRRHPSLVPSSSDLRPRTRGTRAPPGAARQSVINAFQELGVDGEGIERFGMVTLDVPPAADLATVQRLLNHGVSEEW